MSARWKDGWVKPIIVHNVPTRWNWIVLYPERLFLGEYVDIGAYTIIQAEAVVELQDFVQIGGMCGIYSVNSIDETRGKVVIGAGSKIGAHSLVFPNVTIGENSVVGAFSLVKNNILSNEIWMGVPARKVGTVTGKKRQYDGHQNL